MNAPFLLPEEINVCEEEKPSSCLVNFLFCFFELDHLLQYIHLAVSDLAWFLFYNSNLLATNFKMNLIYCPNCFEYQQHSKIKVSRDLNKKEEKIERTFLLEAAHWYSIRPTSSKLMDDNQINDIQE